MQDKLANTFTTKKWYDTKITIDVLIHVFCFISVLFIGADLLGVNIGVNLRYDQIFLVIFSFLLCIKHEFIIYKNKWLLAFAFFSFVSVIFGVSLFRGLLFYFSIVYNIVFIYLCFSNYVRVYGIATFIKILRYTCYVQAFIFFLQYFLKIAFNYEFHYLPPSYGEFHGIPRFRLWFYEPSYLATYMIFWFTIALYMLFTTNQRKYLLDVCLCGLMLILCTASTGFIGMALAIVLVLFFWLKRGITLKKMIFLGLLIIGILIVAFIFRDIVEVFIGRLFNQSLDSASGGRISGWNETFEVFKENPWFGVGPGNYGLYLDKGNAHVASNVTLELMATLGIFGTVSFIGLNFYLLINVYKTCKNKKSYTDMLAFACLLGLIVFTVVLQINQGYLRLYHWMIFGILDGIIMADKKNRK